MKKNSYTNRNTPQANKNIDDAMQNEWKKKS